MSAQPPRHPHLLRFFAGQYGENLTVKPFWLDRQGAAESKCSPTWRCTPTWTFPT